MGKRKRATKKPSTTKKQQKLETVFTCPMCAHEKVVDCTIDRESGIGKCECRVCCATFQCSISKLEIAIDVYSYWIDALEEINTPAADKPSVLPDPGNRKYSSNSSDGLRDNGNGDSSRLRGAGANILDDEDDDDY